MIWLIVTASRTFVCFSSAFVTPRSAKTLPELEITSDLTLPFCISHLIVSPSITKPSTNQLGVFPCGLYPARGLLLEGMKYVDGLLEFDRVYRSIGVSAMVLDYFEDPWSFPSPRFCTWVLATKLRNAPISFFFFLCLLPALSHFARIRAHCSFRAMYPR